MAPFQQLTRECATLAGLTELGDLVEEVELRHEAGDLLRRDVASRRVEVHAEKVVQLGRQYVQERLLLTKRPRFTLIFVFCEVGFYFH